MVRAVLIWLAAAALAVGGLGVAVRLYMSRAAETVLRPDERVVIRDLRDPLPGNAFLACPPAWCAAAAAPAPVLAASLDQLRQAWAKMIAAQPGVVRVDDGSIANRAVFIQRTPLLRFPDIVTVAFVALGPDRSSLAVYSRSRYGRGDFGANRRRVLRWLERLRSIAGQ